MMTRETLSFHFSVSFLTLIIAIFFFTLPAFGNIEDHITRTESGFYYTIQKGDTLWGLAKQFDNSPWVWPGLWSKNPQILNPHLIYPGQKILIFKKEWQGKDKIVHILAQKSPQKEVKKQPTGKYYTCFEINRLGFIRKEPIPPVGIIFKSLNDNIMMSTENRMYIRPASASSVMKVGDKYIVYRTIGPMKEKNTGKFVGYEHKIEGIVSIIKLDPGYVTGKVEAAYDEIQVNDYVMPYHPRSNKILLKESQKGLKARLIKSERENTMIGENDVVFFDKGKNDGVEPGQSYSIYEQETAIMNPKDRMPVLLAPEYIGKLLVVHTEPTTSTAYVTSSLKDIKSGFLVGDLGD